MTAKARYEAGDWFAIPLPSGGFAVVLVARASRHGVLFGYFFGPRRGAVPAVAELQGLGPEDAALVGKFGHLGIVQETWLSIGRLEGWDRKEWPMPAFIRNEELSGRSFLVWYDEDHPSEMVGQKLITPGQAVSGPPDGLMGDGYVASFLDRILHWTS